MREIPFDPERRENGGRDLLVMASPARTHRSRRRPDRVLHVKSGWDRAMEMARAMSVKQDSRVQVRVCGPFRPEDHDLHIPGIAAYAVQEIR